jgi:hypothetical protein
MCGMIGKYFAPNSSWATGYSKWRWECLGMPLQIYRKNSDNYSPKCTVRGASKIKLKKANKKRTVTVRRVIIF